MFKKIVMTIAIFALLLAAVSFVQTPALSGVQQVAFAETTSGTCGENLTWVLDSNGKLTISGTGAMTNYSSSVNPPWNDYLTSITSVVIEEGVTTIGDYAFRTAKALTSVSIPDTVETIGLYSFQQCSALESITVPANVKKINGYAFSNTGLKNVTLNNGLETLGVGAFENCKMESISIPESVTSIGSYAFYNCTSLKSINIPKNITALSEYMLSNCTALENISVSPANSSFSSADGIVFDKYKQTVIKCPEGKSGSYSVPSGVKAIADSAFISCTKLTEIILPDTVSSIGTEAFYGCTSIKEMKIPSGVSAISYGSLRSCSALEKVIIPSSVTIIESYAFHNSNNLCLVLYAGTESEWGQITIATPNGLLADAIKAYNYNPNNANAVVASGTCGAYLNWTLDSTGKLTISGEGIMSNYKLEDLPWYKLRNLITSVEMNAGTTIGINAFNGCVNLKSVKLCSGIGSVGQSAFYGCTSLESITLPSSITAISGNAFQNCTALKEIAIPSGVKHINAFMFDGCTALEKVTIPESVTSMDTGVFRNCTSLESISLPSGLTQIGSYSFQGCTALKEIEIPSGVTYIDPHLFDGCTSLKSISIPEGVTTIDKAAFADCTALESVTFPSTLKTVGGSAFRRCSALKKIVLPEGLTTISGYAFEYCNSLEEITMPRTVTTVSDYAFNECKALSTIYYGGNSDEWVMISIYGGNTPLTSAYVIMAEYFVSFVPVSGSDVPETQIKKLGEPLIIPDVVPEKEGYIFVGWYFPPWGERNLFVPGGTFDVDTNITLEALWTQLSITSQPQDTSAHFGDNASIDIQAEGEGLTYEWYYKDVNDEDFIRALANGTNYAVEITEETAGREVYCVITNKYGNKIESETVTLYGVGVTEQPVNAFGGIGKTLSAKVTAVGEELTYEWYALDEGGTAYYKTPITTDTYSLEMSVQTAGRIVYCVVTDKFGTQAASDIARFCLFAITETPQNTFAAPNAVASVNVTAMGNGLTYEWYVRKAGESDYTASGESSDDKYSLTMNSDNSGTSVYCRITDAYGNTLTTKPVTLAMLSITSQPKDAFAVIGKNASATVAAAGDDLTYAWFVKDPDKSTFTKSSMTSSTYSFKMTEAKSGRKLYCVVTDKYGNSITTETVTLSAAVPPVITAQPQNASALLGKSVSATVKAEGEGLTYKWYVCEPGKTSFYKSSITSSTYSYKMTEAKDGRKAYCVVTNSYGASVTSNTVTLTMEEPKVIITKQPQNASAQPGMSVSVSIKAEGEGLTYTWYICEPGKTKFGKSSITSSTYSYKMTEAKDGRKVYCVVTDANGFSVTSNTVTLTMEEPTIIITKQPQNASAILGKNVSTSVAAEGEGLTYAWYICEPGKTAFGKSSITSSTYSYKMTEAKDGRKVYCIITDAEGNTVKTNTVTLTKAAKTPLAITTQPANAFAASGEIASTKITAQGDGLTYTWYVLDPGKSEYVKSSITKSTYACTMTAAKDGRRVYCIVTDQYGESVKSSIAFLAVE